MDRSRRLHREAFRLGTGAIALLLAFAPAAAMAAEADDAPPSTAPVHRPVPPPAPPSAARLTRPAAVPADPLRGPLAPLRRGPKPKTILIGATVGALVVGVVVSVVVAASRPSQIPRETNPTPPNHPGWRL